MYDAHMKIDPVKGESQKKGFEGQIELLSFSWGAANPSSAAFGSGSGTGKVSVHDFSIVKRTDKASAPFFQKCCDGTHFDKAIVTLQKAAGATPIQYLVYTFEKVFVTSIQWSGSGGGQDDSPMESASFSFEKCEIDYTPQKSDGTPDVAIPATWNIGTNTK